MVSKRNPNVVTAQILEICTEGASKMRVVYNANLNSVIGTQYLDNMIKSGLIEVIPDGARFIYRTTSKGLEMQEKLWQLNNIMENLYLAA